jgi:hypothetical protein
MVLTTESGIEAGGGACAGAVYTSRTMLSSPLGSVRGFSER